ncbi:MAG TPA: hypothetical protein VGS20_06280 [Candidatus Acidoferrales bacterium]|nr:hypothetical protein [Candidatus Acidoferrales bacterium]
MSQKEEPPVISPAMLPRAGITEVNAGDRAYLQRNDAMFTGMRHGQGEFSDFFRSLRDEGRIFGHRCPHCRHLIVPPFMKRCPACNFVEMDREYVRDLGVTAATPVITVFAPSRFKGEVPFGTGRVFLDTSEGKRSDTAMLVRVRTTRGTIRPGIFGRGTPVKIAFRDDRRAGIEDIFALPQSELTPEQLCKSPLLESEIEWGRVGAQELGEITPQRREALLEVETRFRKLGEMIRQSARATANLANWRRVVNVQTGGGAFSFLIEDGTLRVQGEIAERADLIVRVADPAILLAWLRDCTEGAAEGSESPALTDLVIDGTLVLNKPELESITRLDRVPRSLRRDHVPTGTGGR